MKEKFERDGEMGDVGIAEKMKRERGGSGRRKRGREIERRESEREMERVSK